MEPNKHVCVLAWNHIATNQNGNLRLCCNSNAHDNLIKDQDNKMISITDFDLDLTNNEWLKSIKQKMLANEPVLVCKKCQDLENLKLFSPRNHYNTLYGKTLNNILQTQTLEHKAEYLDLRFGNLCNLKCRMCSPVASSQWKQDWQALFQREYQGTVIEWYNDPNFQKFFENHATDIDMIYLTGGEPTLIDSHYEFFDILINKHVAKNIKLKYNTNLTNIPSKLLDYWQHFKQIKVNASIDSYGELNRYIRYPSSWKKIEENFNKLLALKQDNKAKYIINISPTIQILNVFYLCEWLDWLASYKDLINPPYLNYLEKPYYYNIRALPQEIKNEIEKKYQNYNLINVEWKHKLTETVNYMNDGDFSVHWPTFINITKKLDLIRNENVCQTNPQFEKYFKV